MNLNNFTIKSQEAIQRAFEIAHGNQHQAVETGHLLKGVLNEADSLSSYILKKTGINIPAFNGALDRIIGSYPKVTGGEQYLSSQANQALERAMKLSKEAGDQFVSADFVEEDKK